MGPHPKIAISVEAQITSGLHWLSKMTSVYWQCVGQ